MNETPEIPEHIRKATVEIFFKVNSINEWALMGIQSRRSEPELADEKRQVATLRIEHAIVEMQRDRLVEQLATERAAREQAEKQILMDTECIERIRKAGEMAEARLAEALDHIRWLQPMAKGWAHAHGSIASNHRIVLAADEFLSRTTPPPLLVELTRLRELERNAADYFPSKSEEELCIELAALKLKLEVASRVFTNLPLAVSSIGPCSGTKDWNDGYDAAARHATDVAKRKCEEALSQLNESNSGAVQGAKPGACVDQHEHQSGVQIPSRPPTQLNEVALAKQVGGALKLKLDDALDVLQQLRDHQNGCPLPKYERGWGEAMDRSLVLLADKALSQLNESEEKK